MSMEDVAQAIELRQWELNNRKRQEVKRFTPSEPGYGPEHCSDEDCDATIPVKRREWGFAVCVECQSAAEAQARHFRG